MIEDIDEEPEAPRDGVEEEGFNMADPEEVEEIDVAIEQRHVLLALGGTVVAGLIVFVGWEYVSHRLRKRRLQELTSNIAEIARASADVMHEMSHMSPQEEFVEEIPAGEPVYEEVVSPGEFEEVVVEEDIPPQAGNYPVDDEVVEEEVGLPGRNEPEEN